jgi:hypothetical protein
MRSCPRPFRPKTRSSLTFTRSPARLALAASLCGLALSGCADFTVVAATPVPSAATLSLPPIGYNHRYGNNPVAAHDGYNLERSNYAQQVYWEVAIHTDPVQAGYVQLGNAAQVAKARHAVTSVTLVLATEDRRTITGLLAEGTDQAQELYAETFLNRLRALGYDTFSKAQVLIFFTESDEHGQLTWSQQAGYTYKVFDNDLRSTGITPAPGETPLPSPGVP